jgi:hypothetical protein
MPQLVAAFWLNLESKTKNISCNAMLLMRVLMQMSEMYAHAKPRCIS